jgi:23S rRNA (uracil1939-C5)-methyltransferase
LYGICGGCSLQHLSYGAQLDAKAAILKNAFLRIGRIPLSGPIRVIPSPPWGYRNRVQLHRAKDAVGFKARRGAGVVPVSACPVAADGVNEALKGGLLTPPPGRDRFTVYAAANPPGLLLSEGGKTKGEIRLLGRSVCLDAGVFFQGNAFMQEKLITEVAATAVASAAPLPPGPAADLYAGVGVFALFLRDHFPRIDVVEENRAAVAVACENLFSPGEGIAFFAMKDEDWVTMKCRDAARNADYGFLVADPPRRGLSPALRRWLAERGPPLFAYVSCDPPSMARDAGELGKEYELDALSLFDFYPQTAHIESMGIFRRKSGR